MRAWILVLALVVPGCATTEGVRYVYQDGQFGVVGIPENTDCWPTYYRSRAEELMIQHFPEGYEIVRAEEVTEGSRTLKVEGTKTAELMPELPSELLKVGKLGRTASRSQADTVKIRECRIIYRRSPREGQADGYSDVATLTPTPYLDPNEAERHKTEKHERVAGAKAEDKITPTP